MTDRALIGTLVWKDDMKSDKNLWSATGAVDWTNAHYVILTQEEKLISREWSLYGVATFDAFCDDWTNVLMGFYDDTTDYVVFDSDQFTSRKMDIAAPPTTPMALTDSTWYHFVLIWCPQFVSLEVYNLAGALQFYGKHRNPPIVEMPLRFEVDAASGTTLYVGCVAVQEGDDPQFFLDRRKTVMLPLVPFAGANYDPRVGATIDLNAGGEVAEGHTFIMEPHTRYRVHFRAWVWVIWALGLDMWVADSECGGTVAWDRIVNRRVNLAGAANIEDCYTTEWLGTNGQPQRIALRLLWFSGQARVGGACVEYE